MTRSLIRVLVLSVVAATALGACAPTPAPSSPTAAPAPAKPTDAPKPTTAPAPQPTAAKPAEAAKPTEAPKPAAQPTTAAAPPAAKPQDVRTLQVGLLPAIDFLGFYVAIEKGFLEEQGINVELKILAGGAEIVPALVGGSLDVGINNSFSHVLAKDNGFDLKAIAGGSVQTRARQQHAILVKGDSPIQAAKDLEGKTIAINTLNNIDHVMVQEWLDRNGVDPAKVNFVEVPFPQHPPALAQGRMDASAPPEPFTTILQSQGARIIARHYTDTNEQTLIAYYVATNDWIQKNADVAGRFAAAVHRGNEFVMQNEKEAREIAAKQLRLEPAVAEKVGIPELRTKIDPALLQWWIDAGVKRGLVKRAFDPADLLYETVR